MMDRGGSGDPVEGGDERGPEGPVLRIFLVGFMASGKSVVGRRLARRLGWRFRDMDRAVEEADGRKVARIFAEEGELRFREMEQAAALRLLAEEGVVVATGGGWPCFPGRLDDLGAGTLAVWLDVPVEVAVARVRAGRSRRPLLEVDDPEARARELMAVRAPFYRKAHWRIETPGMTPGQVAAAIAGRLEGR
jgi:shikimate kinase